MAEKKKSIIEEALLEAKSLEDALKANTKEILASTMKEEIESVVRESLDEQEEIEDNEEIEGHDDEMTDDLKLPAGEEAGEDSEELELDLDVEAGEEEGEEPEVELDLDLDAEEGGEELGLPMGDLEGDEMGMELGDEEGMLDLGDEEELDLTMASDEEVLKVFKSMGDTDEVEVVKDADGISLKDNTTGAEYYIKESEELDEGEMCEGCGSGMYSEEEDLDETIYEVELDEDMYEAYMESKEMEEGEEISETEEMEEMEEVKESSRRTLADRRNKSHKPSNHPARRNESRSRRKPTIKESKNDVRKGSYEKLLKEYKELKVQNAEYKTKNGEYKEALKVFKTKINEVALFNQNLAHVTKLFTEHSTTKKEKMAILGRFDNVETIKESKSLYKTIETELSDKTPINESVEKKVNKTVESSKSNLNESTAYVDPQINKIKDLMNKIS
jgi:hypothetical protein